jgi:hypothetical protein
LLEKVARKLNARALRRPNLLADKREQPGVPLPEPPVVTHFESRRAAISSTLQTWSEMPVSIAGVTLKVW